MLKPSLWCASFLLCLLPLVAAAADEAPLTTITPEGGRVVQEGARVDVYDAKSNRIGYGYIRGDGSVDLYHMDGSRKATIQRGPSGETRVTVPRGKR